MNARALLLGCLSIAAYAGCEASGRDPIASIDDRDAAGDARARDSARDGLSDGDSDADITEEGGGADAEADVIQNEAGSNDGGVEGSTDAPTDTATAPAPIVNGTIATGEYGSHVEGENQRTISGTTWFMATTATHLHIAVTNANVAEGLVFYVAPSAIASDGGTAAAGATVGQPYDNTKLDPLPYRATFVAYMKSTYDEVRVWDGATAWGAPDTGAIVSSTSGTTRELSIPWSSMGGRPASFAWLGYVTSGGGFTYGTMPPDNPAGAIGTSADFPFSYLVADSSPGAKPFALRIP